MLTRPARACKVQRFYGTVQPLRLNSRCFFLRGACLEGLAEPTPKELCDSLASRGSSGDPRVAASTVEAALAALAYLWRKSSESGKQRHEYEHYGETLQTLFHMAF